MAVKRVLIVDDERLARISLADFLQESGYEVIAVSDGESAIRQQQQQPFDVCIVDIRMPSMNGVETMLALHRAGPDSLYIVYTGSPQFVVTPALEEIGLTEQCVVRKPVIDMGVFVALIDAELPQDREG
jgi:DNA-binding NtrC family response regulator